MLVERMDKFHTLPNNLILSYPLPAGDLVSAGREALQLDVLCPGEGKWGDREAVVLPEETPFSLMSFTQVCGDVAEEE